MIALLISIIAIALTIFLYYKNIHLALLRIVALIILFILITNITLTIRSKEKTNPPVFLIDCSASMARYVPTIVQEVDKVAFSYTAAFFFSESLLATTSDEVIRCPGRFTDITSALSNVGNENPSAILMISDGNHNYGESPLSIAENLMIPIYCFGVGSTTESDLSIVDVSYPAYAFKEDTVKIEAVIESKGFSGGKGEVSLKLASAKKGHKKSFFLSDVAAKNTVDFLVYATEPGVQKVQLYVAPHPDEENRGNNIYEFSLHVLEKKIKVLYVTDHLSFNTKFILRVLGEDNHVELFPLIKIGNDTYRTLDKKGDEHTLPPLDDYDAVVFDNVNFSTLPWRGVETFLNTGKGILCIGSIIGLTNEWRTILPITVSETVMKSDYPITIIQPFSFLAVGDDYPPFSYVNRTIGVKENTIVLAEADQLPIIAYRGHGGGMVFQINAIDIGSWQFLQAGLRKQNALFQFIGDIIRFISPLGQRGRLILTSLRRDYAVGEIVNLMLQSFDRDFRLVGGGDFYCTVGTITIPFFELKEGTYEATFLARESDTFQIMTTGKLGPETLNSNTLKIAVLPKAIETERGLNRQLLQALSEVSGGSYHSLHELTSFEPPQYEKRYFLNYINFNSPISYFLIFILFAVDWFMRRRRGIV